MEVSVICEVHRVNSETKFVSLVAFCQGQAKSEITIDLAIERKKGREALAVRYSDVVLQIVDVRVRKAGVARGRAKTGSSGLPQNVSPERASNITSAFTQV